jgi:hypothetical protein
MDVFHTIAVPHSDILEGRLTMDVFAADLWEVHKGRGPDEYKEPEEFFHKTYQTVGLKNLLETVEKRLNGEGGDAVIQVQTPFGGGKTHSLIAMYHQADKWGSKRAVLVGTALSPKETVWGELERQLTGKVSRLEGFASPGREAIRSLLEENQPLLILMDEILEYVTKAAGVRVEESNLAAQTIAFVNELTEAAGTLDPVCLVVSLPSSVLEHFDESAENLFQQLRKVSGRVEKIYTPVQEHEITHVIRQRLFSTIDNERARNNVRQLVEYIDREGLLPSGEEASEYRKRFESSFPFTPEVVEVLYHRWGSFSTFQRTRGVLRLLSLVLHSLKDSALPYITLADFDLDNQEIRRELLKHIGPEFDSVIAADITGDRAGAKQADKELGASFQGLGLGRRTSTAVFMYSFSGGTERGVGLGEAKRNATTNQNPSSVITDVVDKLMEKLFYIYRESGKLYFSNIPNLNRILVIKKENIESQQLRDYELQLLKDNISAENLKVVLWPKKTGEVPDDQDLKLVILPERDELMEQILEDKGTTPRVNKNTVLFLVPKEAKGSNFRKESRTYLAYKAIQSDETLNLTEKQRKQVDKKVDEGEKDFNQALLNYYSRVYLPAKDGFKEIDLGIPTYGEKTKIDQAVYEKLRSEEEILFTIAPLYIKEKYLKKNRYVETKKLYSSTLTTPGETRTTGREVWEDAIQQGVLDGVFGMGEIEDDKPTCHYYKKSATVGFSDNEAIIRDTICQSQVKEEVQEEGETGRGEEPGSGPGRVTGEPYVPDVGGLGQGRAGPLRERVEMSFEVPRGRVSDLMGVLNLLQSNFERINIQLEAEQGSISEQDYEDKVREAFRQMGIDIGD